MIAVSYHYRVADIDLRHLKALVAIADEGTFGRAAARLGFTQASVSQQIAALEKAVGGSVFDRPGGPKRVRLTPLGEVVLAHSRDILMRTAGLSEAVERYKAGEGRIDIGTFQSVSNLILPAVVRQLLDEHPGCDIRLSEVDPGDPQIKDLDLLFHDDRIEGSIDRRKLLDEPYPLVARAGAFPEGPVPVKLLHDARMIAWPSNFYQNWLEQMLARAGARPRIVFRTTGHETILSMVRAGIGSAVLPWLALRGADIWQDVELSVHQLHPSPTRELFLHWPTARTQSPLATRAIEVAVEIARDLDDQIHATLPSPAR